jgi:hypothetical protein
MSVLCNAGYARVRKKGHGRSGQTWFAATAAGRKALKSHVAALHALVDNAPIAST